MYDPCARCPCILRQEVCRKFCTAYKAAVEADVRSGMVQMGRDLHDRIARKDGHK